MKGNCKGCGVEITIVEGRRPREFHSDACRNKYYYRQSSVGVEPKPKGRPKKVVLMADKKTAQKERDTVNEASKKAVYPLTQDEAGQNPHLATLEAIAAIRAEKIPSHRDTLLGRKAWKQEQDKRIEELQKKITG